MNARLMVTSSYLGLIGIQFLWHALLPQPMGNRSWLLAVIAAAPLFLPLRGLLAGSLRAMTWAGYLVMLYLIVGITETWSNPAQRVPALAQTLLVVLFVASLLVFSRSKPAD